MQRILPNSAGTQYPQNAAAHGGRCATVVCPARLDAVQRPRLVAPEWSNVRQSFFSSRHDKHLFISEESVDDLFMKCILVNCVLKKL
jgi:hypothetical protein